MILNTDESTPTEDSYPASFSGVLTHVQNPITREEIKLNPPFWFRDDDELNMFLGHIEDYCSAAYRLGRISPADIDAPYGWVASAPYTPGSCG